MKEYKVVIIGAGASGLVAAIMAATNFINTNNKVLVLDTMDKPGKKILATGNGRCNLGNQYIEKNNYFSENIDFPFLVMNSKIHEEVVEFFETIGLYTKNNNGYLYPMSMQAQSVVNVLYEKAKSLGVLFEFEQKVEKIIRQKDRFIIETNNKLLINAKRVIVSTGGKSNESLGSDGSGYQLCKALGHSIITPVPALTALKSKDKSFKKLAGIRTMATASLFIDNKLINKTQGELQLTNYGISGIMIFQLSRFASVGLNRGQKVKVVLDLLPDYNSIELEKIIRKTIEKCGYKTTTEMLEGIINNKLAGVIVNLLNIDEKIKITRLTKVQIEKLIGKIKEFSVDISETNDFSQSQVTAGGINTKEINPKTMESLICKNLYLSGEILDVDGICGGYNLMWAWITGKIAGNSSSIK